MGLFDRLFSKKKVEDTEVLPEPAMSEIECDRSEDVALYETLVFPLVSQESPSQKTDGSDDKSSKDTHVKEMKADDERQNEISEGDNSSEEMAVGFNSISADLVSSSNQGVSNCTQETGDMLVASILGKVDKSLTTPLGEDGVSDRPVEEPFTNNSREADPKDLDHMPIETVADKYDRSLEKTRTGFRSKLNAFFANFRQIDEEFFEDLEELLILSDVGVQVATTLTENLRQEAKIQKMTRGEELKELVIKELVDLYDGDGIYRESINWQTEAPTVMLFVGVNGVGKTTSIGKLAYKYTQEGKSVMLVAADTFRAGAVAQLVEWGNRVGVPVVTGPEKSDPASVVFDGVEKAVAEGIDILMIDTAGRLQNKDNLMAELEKIGRIIARTLPNAPHEILLAIDASTGQNALIQAKEFFQVAPLTGLVLTKIDGTAKGGIVLAIRQELDLPVKYIGFGEKIDDIGEFSSEQFMTGLLKGMV